MKTLIIAEKPKLASNCVGALSLMGESAERKQGYYEGKKYIVSWCVGHLFGLKGIDDYTGESSWKKVPLPYIPDPFEFKLKDSLTEQYEVLQKLLKRTDVEKVFHCGDADREGEVIVRMVLSKADCKLPVYRIWTDDQTEAGIRDAINNIKPDSDYDALYNEGLARTYLDWLYGINLTRYITNRTNAYPILRVGRVLIPIVKKIYDRELAIRNFKSVPYLQAEGTGTKDGIKYVLIKKNSEPRMSDAQVKTLVQQLQSGKTTVTKVQKKEKNISRPKLFDLGKAQSRIAKLHKISLTDSMGCIQALYEAGYLTYPRTDSEFLATTEMEKVEDVLAAIKKANPEIRVAMRTDKTVFDDAKVIGHSALRPTHKIPSSFGELVSAAQSKANNKKITADTIRKTYEVIYNRFCAVFAEEDCVVSDTTVTIQNGEHSFELTGKETIRFGFLKYDNTEKKDKDVPAFSEGEELLIHWMASEKETTPPKHLTVEGLDNYLRNPFKDEEEDDYKAIASGLSIGTQATRTGIIQNAIDSNYISLKENSYYLESRGELLIQTLDSFHINLYKQKTVELNQRLIAVRNGEITIDACIKQTADELQKIIQEADATDVAALTPDEKSYVCPFCSGTIRRSKYGFYCISNNDFSFNKIYGKDITDEMMDAFMQNRKILVKGLKGSKGNFDAYIIPSGWKKDGKFTNLEHTLEFATHKRRKKTC